MNKKAQKLFLSCFLLTVILNNSTKAEEIETDSIQKIENILDSQIIKDAEDSIKIKLRENKAYLYGNASIRYKETSIKAGFIEIDWNTNSIRATAHKDTSGELIGQPIFTEGSDNYHADEIIYNFKTKKSIIRKIVTKEGEGHIHGEKVKKNKDNIFFIHKGDYTTCDAKKPHFSIRSNKIKVIPGKRIITGPAHLRLWNIPTPLILPFGYFPNNDKQSSGILIPSYGESNNLGFFLKNGGYYFGLNDKIDIALRTDIYTKGSWSARSIVRYKERYKYNGNLKLSFGNMINSEKDLPDYTRKRDFFIRWKHQKDPKANPSILFNANVNAGSSTFHKNNSYNADEYLTNTFQSNISLSKRWEGTPFNLSTNLRHSQNTKSKIINLSIPEIAFNMNRVFPLKKIGNTVKDSWYKTIGISYSMNTRNEITIADSLLFTKNAFKKFRNGMRHNIPISFSTKVFKYFTLTPRLNLTERWYLSQIEKKWDTINSTILTDTLNRFTRGLDYNVSTSLNTKIYGILQFGDRKISAIRHVITPNIGFSYRPDFSNEKYGYYKSVQSGVNGEKQTYSIMQNGIFGSPGKNKSGNINFSLGNNLEMKIRSKKDTSTTLKKVKILESLNISSSYNIFADSLNLNNITVNGRTRIMNFLDLTFSSRYDPYMVNKNKNGNLHNYEINNGRIARFVSANANLGINLSDKTFIKDTRTKEDENKEKERDFYQIPWNFNVNYSISYNKGFQSSLYADTTQSLNFSGNFKITPKWKIGFRSGYDFETKKLSYSSVDIYRDLHCWEMLFHWIPTGFHKSYTLTIRVKSDILKDLKLERKKDWIDPDYN